MSRKDGGRNFRLKCFMNWTLKYWANMGKGRMLSFLNRGSVCELYLEFVMILTAIFCLLKIGFRRDSLQQVQS